MFFVRNIFPDQGRVEAGKFDLVPSHEQGEAVCRLFREFLRDRPAEFRDRIGFLKKGNFELDWTAASGGAALACIIESGEPLTMAVLLAGVNREADDSMISGFKENVLAPLFGDSGLPVSETADRPLLLQVIFPGSPEWTPAVQLLSSALASVFFRTIFEVDGNSRAEA